jgi:transcriptional regulator with XRE-family HTH domain
MKTLGEQAKEFRESKGWNASQMAARVGTSRQNIESLEAIGNRIPKYLGQLAAVMGRPVDDLLSTAGLLPERSARTLQEPGARYDTLTDAERQILDDFRVLPDEDQIEIAGDIAHRAVKARAHIKKVLSGMGLAEQDIPVLGPATEKEVEVFKNAHVSVPGHGKNRKAS